MIKRTNDQAGTTIINIYALNSKAPNYIKQTLREMRNRNIIVGNFNTLLPVMNRVARGGKKQ